MEETPISQILEHLRLREQEAAWGLFLREYGHVIFQVARRFERNADDASDCFQFICEQLVKDSFRRLRKFKPDGPASFSTWLRAVVRNLCIDWQRKKFGRAGIAPPVSQFSDSDHPARDLADPKPDPEAQAILEEKQALVNSALRRLAKRERLMLRLRFEEELTLDQIAKLLDLGNAQRADRQIKDVLCRLQSEIGGKLNVDLSGKKSRSSVKVL